MRKCKNIWKIKFCDTLFLLCVEKLVFRNDSISEITNFGNGKLVKRQCLSKTFGVNVFCQFTASRVLGQIRNYSIEMLSYFINIKPFHDTKTLLRSQLQIFHIFPVYKNHIKKFLSWHNVIDKIEGRANI